ncbi:MAG: hypothetical protein UV73_C0003G0206 [Candidatus Gottesmanbacteria bacterium GW2011_GWA2_43_14]|uniref:Uncharacterized protein n=1 Tax=Candidatus Gottesmanbacteria bacterium GW2011_GWA2_43_14 TaxID=1618443 RepID=A0A0G1DKT4_9BACT|nr:MAG: hypothetical protein UV73_C0003G0206 [Candidatus Gottesmanbacteria bacterium GW2011_GWA2_43_14]
MFDYKHYISVLRWKAAEREALGNLSDENKKSLTPLIELIMPQTTKYKIKEGGVERVKTPAELLDESIAKMNEKIPQIPEEILKYWGETPAFIDFSKVDFSIRSSGLQQILSLGLKLKLNLIPAVSLSSDDDVKLIVATHAKEYKLGLCLRLFRSDFTTALKSSIEEFLSKYNLSEAEVDLVLDFQITDSKCLDIEDFITQIPNISKWRTFTTISGTFPKDLMDFTPDMHFIDRADWNCWLSQINSGKLSRKPSFGDYTIQHPIYSEPAPGSNPSASIRYTLKDKWMLMRGQGLRSINSAGHAQYPALAHLLLEREEFFGKDFSEGDAYVEKIGSDISTKETGNPRTWLRAGINHHMACTISQLASLS